MRTLSHNGLIQKLKQPGTQIVGIQSFTKVSNKEIYKQIRTVGLVGSIYENAVNREAERQGKTSNF